MEQWPKLVPLTNQLLADERTAALKGAKIEKHRPHPWVLLGEPHSPWVGSGRRLPGLPANGLSSRVSGTGSLGSFRIGRGTKLAVGLVDISSDLCQ